MRRSGSADLPLHGGKVPFWLSERMSALGGSIVACLVQEFGTTEVLRRLADPFWFQSFGAVMGMDWHSSGITISVLGALKKSVNSRSAELGLFICGGKGRHSLQTPAELLRISDKTGLNGENLSRSSRLVAKVDNTALQDGFQLYLHSFILDQEGNWAVIQQGMDDRSGLARRYHWLGKGLKTFSEEPHAAVEGHNRGLILNLTAKEAALTKSRLSDLVQEEPQRMLNEIRRLVMPRHHDIRLNDVDLKRLGSVLYLAHHTQPKGFDELLLTEGLGPRTLQALTLVSEVIYGTPSRFKDPARFAFAHGGKDGHPFPVPLKVFDQTIRVMEKAVNVASVEQSAKKQALKSLHQLAKNYETGFVPEPKLEEVIQKERRDSWKYGGRTVFGKAMPSAGEQLRLF